MKANMPNVINNIQFIKEIQEITGNNRDLFEITIKRNEKILYQNKGFAGVVNVLQEDPELDLNTGYMNGDSQVFVFGEPLDGLFALDQIRTKMREFFMIGANFLKGIIQLSSLARSHSNNYKKLQKVNRKVQELHKEYIDKTKTYINTDGQGATI